MPSLRLVDFFYIGLRSIGLYVRILGILGCPGGVKINHEIRIY